MACRLRRAVLFSIVVVASVARVASAASLVGPFEKDEYPQAVIDRPLTLPAGMVEGELGFQFTSRKFAEPSYEFGAGIDDWDADVTLRVGVTDRIQVEVGTAFSLDHTIHHDPGFQGAEATDLRPSFTSWHRVVPVRLSFLALDTDTLDTALRLTIPFVAHADRSIRMGPRGGRIRLSNGEGRVIPAVGLDAPTRWRLTDWLWLRAGENLFSVTTDGDVAAFSFDFGVGVQPHEMLALTLDSRVATVGFDGSGHSFSTTVTDFGVIDLEATFAPCRFFDVVGDLLLPDVGVGFDDYALRMAVRVRL